MFSDYQMQEMSDNFIDSFGFQDDEFTESDENVRSAITSPQSPRVLCDLPRGTADRFQHRFPHYILHCPMSTP